MRRREFGKATTAAAVLVLTGCGGGGGGGGGGGAEPVGIAPGPEPGPTPAAPPAGPAPQPTTGPGPGPTPAPSPVAAAGWVIGTNLTGMQVNGAGLRFGPGSVPNVDFSVPRRADVAWLASNGYRKSRLPIQWEMLQPMLSDTPANAAVRAAVGAPGAFHPGYESYITGVLDAHAAAGTRCIIDLHNYCRYQDFVYQPDGSVVGLVVPSDALIRPYTSDNTQVQQRIFALAPGATLKQSQFNDFWTRAALKWKDHAGFGGYGLMNEPYNMPEPGAIVASDGYNQDLTIWPAYAQAAINAIRAVDPSNPIYLGGNGWSAAMSLASVNPGWPLSGANIIYEVHLYLDAASNGQSFDYDIEVAKNFSAGLSGPINPNTGVDRLNLAVSWAQEKGVKLALTETGMPIDDPRWQDMFQRLLARAREVDCEVYSWNGGNHWAYHNAGINHVPGWHQNRTLEPSMSGPMKAAAGVALATLFDDGPGWAPSAGAVTITVYARGSLASPVTVTVSSDNAGTLSKTQLTIPAGANGQDTFSFTPGPNRVTTLSYTASGGIAPPAPRKVYSLVDPVGYSATSLADAAMAILAKYSACKWELADGYTDYLSGSPSADGQAVRAMSDSGYGSSPGNAMEMINWTNTDSTAMGNMAPPVMRVVNGRKHSDHSASNTNGFWCRKSISVPGLQPNPRNRAPYDLQDPHFAIAAVSVPGPNGNGTVFQASHAAAVYACELSFSNGQPQAKWRDNQGAAVVLTSPAALPATAPAVVSLMSAAGTQRLRVNSALSATAARTFATSAFDQMLIGWGFLSYQPRDRFTGNIFAVITGKGTPTDSEMGVLERYLGTVAGI